MFSCLYLLLAVIHTVTGQISGGEIGWVGEPTDPGPAWPLQTFVTEPILRPPVIKTDQSGPAGDNPIFLDIQGTDQQAGIIVSPSGSLLWSGGNGSLVNLTPETLNGQPVMLAWNGTTIGHLEAYGSILIFDDSYELIYDVKLQDPELGNEWPSYANTHEVFLTGRGSVVVTTAVRKGPTDLSFVGGPTEGYFWDCLIYEIDVKTNQVLFKWSTADHNNTVPLTDSRALPFGVGYGWGNTTFPWNPYHMNSAQAVDDGYVFSLRHTSTVYHVVPNGTVTWQIHGSNETPQMIQQFQMGANTSFSWQHDARVASKSNSSLELHLVDNNNELPTQHNETYGLILTVDLNNMSVTEMARLTDEKDPQGTFAGGSFAKLDGDADSHWFIDYGFVPVVKEFDAAGNCILTMQFGPKEGSILSYRAFRAEWHGYPKTKPKVGACWTTDRVHGPVTRVHASWNGATEVAGWNVLLGSSSNSNTTGLTKMGAANRTGFETVTEIQGTYTFVQVESIGGGRAPHTNVTSEIIPVDGTCV
ncbi:uncharacterized protein PG998_004426 [Apiospora kogelbergensis]|uniref:uncharacterized protein n=1 Tax=Apiospora kogelbergensis TaxID=1337665 RepID=UPI00312CED02